MCAYLGLLREYLLSKTVNRLVKVDLQQHQFDALVSFVFNVGSSNFETSTLLKYLNDGELHTVPHQLARWNKSDGKVVAGLVNRRAYEIALYEEADYA